MNKQKALMKNKTDRRIDGPRFSNRNAEKWFLEHDESLWKAKHREKAKALSQGKRISQRQILLELAKDKTFLKSLPKVSGNQRLSDSFEKTYARLAKRAQHPNAIAPPLARALGLGQRKVNIAALRAEIEDTTLKYLRARLMGNSGSGP